MAKQVIWSENAESDLNEILHYWIEKNGNDTYSKKLYKSFREIIYLISIFPKMGRKSNQFDYRFVIDGNFSIYYSESNNYIEILHIWDNRRNPSELRF